jgi:CRP-like cAMP-binding protein
LPGAEIKRVARHLTPVTLKQSTILQDGKSTHAYFLEQGMASVVVSLQSGDTVEVGVVGIDGVVGIPILLGTEGAPGKTFIQIAASGYRIEREQLKEEFERPGQLRNHLQRYIQAFSVLVAQTAACNRLHTIEERLSRWLLSCHDRIGSDQLHLTHDFLGQMLGSPRSTVTLAAGLLQRAGMIQYSRGVVTVRDRIGLEGTACECYQTVRDEFVRLKLL